MDRSAGELRELAVETEDGDVVRRLLSIALVLDGWPRRDAATASGMDRQTLCDWVHRYNAAGVAGLVTGTRSGRPPALSEAQMAELKELVIKGPDPAKDGVVHWRRVDLRMRGFKEHEAADRFFREYDELRHFLRSRSRHNQYVPATRRRRHFLQHARVAMGIMQTA